MARKLTNVSRDGQTMGISVPPDFWDLLNESLVDALATLRRLEARDGRRWSIAFRPDDEGVMRATLERDPNP
jgi:hypothetical protein